MVSAPLGGEKQHVSRDVNLVGSETIEENKKILNTYGIVILLSGRSTVFFFFFF